MLAVVIPLLMVAPGRAQVDFEAGVQFFSGSYGTAESSDVAVASVQIGRDVGRHRLWTELAGISAEGSGDQLHLFLGRVRSAVRSGATVSRQRVRQASEALEPRRETGLR